MEFLKYYYSSILFLGVGYATITDTLLTIDGTAELSGQTGVFITNVTYLSNVNADPSLSEINNMYQTLLDSKIVLANDSTSEISYQVTITNDTSEVHSFRGVLFDPNAYDNHDITYELYGITKGYELNPGQNVTFTVKFLYSETEASYDNTILNSILNFKFTTGRYIVDEFAYDGPCIFNGEGQDIEGACANGEHVDYLNTHIELFNSTNAGRDFEIGFTIDDIDDSRYRSGQVDTIINSIYDNTPYPGIAFRISNSKWMLQVGNGSNNIKKYFDKGSIQTFKIKKTNGKVYYSINGGGFVYINDLTIFPNTFSQPLTFGGAMNPDNTLRPERFLIADLSDIYVRVYDSEDNTFDEYDQMVEDFVGGNLTTAFSQEAAYTFDGTASTVIDTGIGLFTAENMQKDYIISFTIDSLDLTNQPNFQATLLNAKNEAGNNYPGLMLRKDVNHLLLSIRDGDELVSTATIPASATRIHIIKKGMEFFYQFDFTSIMPLGDDNDLSGYLPADYFSVPTTFGGNIDDQGNYNRFINATISDLTIKMSS